MAFVRWTQTKLKYIYVSIFYHSQNIYITKVCIQI